MIDETNAAEYIETAMRGRLDDLTILTGTADGKGEGWADPDKLEALGVAEKHATEDDGVAAEEARERLEEYPLCVDTTTVFEIVLGTGGPDDRLLVECDSIVAPIYGDESRRLYEIRRILYRYSWSGSAERELTGDNYEVAERFARSVVPELAA